MASSVFQLHFLVVIFFHSPVLNPVVRMSHLLTTHYTHRYDVNTSVIWDEKKLSHKRADRENFEVCGYQGKGKLRDMWLLDVSDYLRAHSRLLRVCGR